MDARTPADPFDTMPPYRPGQSDEDALAEAFLWEMHKRFATGPATTIHDWSRASARIALRTLHRKRARFAADHEAAYEALLCNVCGRPVGKDDAGKWVHRPGDETVAADTILREAAELAERLANHVESSAYELTDTDMDTLADARDVLTGNRP